MTQLNKSHSAIKTGILPGIKTFLVASCSCFLLFMLLFSPQEGLQGAREGLTLCGEVIIPSLFPFLALSTFVIQTGLAEKFGKLFEPVMRRIFRLPGNAAAALALGVMGGYPVGAKACAELCRKGALTKKEGNRLLSFCINSSPAYIIGAVGAGLLKSASAGILLYAAHITASLLIGIITGLFHSKANPDIVRRPPIRNNTVSSAFVGAVTGSAASIVNICAFVVLFSALSGLLVYTGILASVAGMLGTILPLGADGSQLINTLARGFLEVTNGCAAAAVPCGMQGLLTIALFLSWSGLSVIFQVTYAVSEAGLSVRYYVLARIFHMLISSILTVLLFNLFPVAVPVFASSTGVTATFHSAPACSALLVICAMLLLSQLTV